MRWTPRPILTKREFYALWSRDLLGNRPRTWDSFEDLVASGYAGTVTIRTIGAAGGKTRYRVPLGEVSGALSTWSGRPTFNESAPDDMLTIQGEVMRSERGLSLYFDTAPNTPMNVARQQFMEAHGLRAKLILDRFLSPCSRDDIDVLLDMYPGHVIEFSTYARNVGRQPHRNTLIWEIRHY